MQSSMSPFALGALSLIIFLSIAIFVIFTFGKKAAKEVAENKTKKTLGHVLLTFGKLPFLIYPFVLLANVMQIAGWEYNEVSVITKICTYVFLFFSSSYPLTYIICYWFFNKSKEKIMIPLMPFVHIFITVLLGVFLGFID